VEYVLAVLALGFLIVVHEGGHYFVARWCGMRIERFSIGFGPGLLKRKSKKTGTTFQLAPIPFGGFVEIRGMNIAEDVDPDDVSAYPNRPAWQRFVTIFAGPATNYISAILLCFALYTCHGKDRLDHLTVDQLMDGNFEAKTKLRPGDTIVGFEHAPIVENLSAPVNARKGAPVTLTIVRDGVKQDVTLTPTKIDDSYLLGIKYTMFTVPVDVSLAEAASDALVYPIDETKNISKGLYGIFAGSEKADPGGPKRMIDEFSNAFRRGFASGVRLLMVLSVYLGLFNLFPLPALDGGRLVFLGYEMVTRRRANPKIESMVHMGGIMVLFVVMILVTLHDFHLF
jgi:regulator of sigma E protease